MVILKKKQKREGKTFNELMTMPIKSGLEAILVLIYCPGRLGRFGEEVRGITRLDKLLYLLTKETDLGKALEVEFRFEAYDYGPYSNEIYDSVEALKDAGLITIDSEQLRDYREVSDAERIEREVSLDEDRIPLTERKLEIYGLSESGMKAGRRLFERLADEEKQGLRKIKERFNLMPLRELVEYVYKKYPESAISSKIRETILGESKFGAKSTMKVFKRAEETSRQ